MTKKKKEESFPTNKFESSILRVLKAVVREKQMLPSRLRSTIAMSYVKSYSTLQLILEAHFAHNLEPHGTQIYIGI